MADTSILARCQNAVVGLLKSKTFAPVPGGVAPVIYREKAQDVLQTGLPAILVTVEGLDDNPVSQPFAWPLYVLWGYGVAVAILDHSSASQQDADVYANWYEIAKLACHTPALAGVSELRHTKIEQGLAIEKQLKGAIKTPEYMRLVGGFIVRCEVITRRLA